MARTAAGRVKLKGELVAQTPLHVGGHGEEADTDLPLARDGAGRLHVPGTSLAGALRAWCAAAFGDKAARAVWGYQEDEEGNASHAVVEDAAVAGGDRLVPEIRDGVGIDREWGAAAQQIKYDRAVLPRGTRLSLELIVEYPGDRRQATIEMVGALAEALRAGEVRLGAAKTRGLGKLLLENGEVREDILDTRPGILALLRGQAGAMVSAARAEPLTRPRLEISVDWRPLGPVMVKAGADGIGVDAVPLVSGIGDRVSPVLPGSSVKGTVRNYAERIVRTLLNAPLGRGDDPKRRFLTHLEEFPLIEAVFGAPGKRVSRDRSTRQDDSRRGLGALAVDDCYAKRQFSRDEWREVIAAGAEAALGQPQSPLRGHLNQAGLEDWGAAFHVAIDRWTGGAAESLLFSVLEPHGTEWEPLRWTLDLTRLAEDEYGPALALLLMVLRDLGRGRLPLGFGTQRGMGAVAVDRVNFAGRGLEGPFASLDGLVLEKGDPASLPADLRAALDAAWSKWHKG